MGIQYLKNVAMENGDYSKSDFFDFSFNES